MKSLWIIFLLLSVFSPAKPLVNYKIIRKCQFLANDVQDIIFQFVMAVKHDINLQEAMRYIFGHEFQSLKHQLQAEPKFQKLHELLMRKNTIYQVLINYDLDRLKKYIRRQPLSVEATFEPFFNGTIYKRLKMNMLNQESSIMQAYWDVPNDEYYYELHNLLSDVLKLPIMLRIREKLYDMYMDAETIIMYTFTIIVCQSNSTR